MPPGPCAPRLSVHDRGFWAAFCPERLPTPDPEEAPLREARHRAPPPQRLPLPSAGGETQLPHRPRVPHHTGAVASPPPWRHQGSGSTLFDKAQAASGLATTVRVRGPLPYLCCAPVSNLGADVLQQKRRLAQLFRAVRQHLPPMGKLFAHSASRCVFILSWLVHVAPQRSFSPTAPALPCHAVIPSQKDSALP